MREDLETQREEERKILNRNIINNKKYLSGHGISCTSIHMLAVIFV